MSVQEILFDALQDLIDDEFSTFKWYLSQKQLDDCRPIARCHLETTKRTEIVSRLLSSYGPDSAVALSVVILQKMCKNFTAQELQKAYAAKSPSGAESVVCPAPSGPNAAAGSARAPAPNALHVTANNGSMIFAPTVSGGTAGTWNINISK